MQLPIRWASNSPKIGSLHSLCGVKKAIQQAAIFEKTIKIMESMLSLKLMRHTRDNGTIAFRLEVSTTLDPRVYVNDGFAGPEVDAATGDRIVTLFAKETNAASGAALGYSVPLGDDNPVPTSSDYLIVRLLQGDGRELDSARLKGGGTVGSTSDAEEITRPFP